jgi:hypothetical protein
MKMEKVNLRTRTRGKTCKHKETATVHLNVRTHALGKIYAGYVLSTQNRQLNTAEAIDELAITGAMEKLPREMLESSKFVAPQTA